MHRRRSTVQSDDKQSLVDPDTAKSTYKEQAEVFHRHLLPFYKERSEPEQQAGGAHSHDRKCFRLYMGGQQVFGDGHIDGEQYVCDQN